MALAPLPAGGIQEQLGDDEDRDARQLALQRDTETRLATLGEGGIRRPKDTLTFLNNVAYKKVGGQQLTANCMWCANAINSTGASRVVDHFLACLLCPSDVKESCMKLRNETVQKRQEKEEHGQLVMLIQYRHC